MSLSYKGDGTTEIFNDKIEKVVLYVFDHNEQLVTTKN
ncbi:MAG: FimB/Mfa2 family fimbrial subunit [Butyricimonas faecihominis]